MAYAKPYLSVSDQLALIKGRGMIISDDALAQAYLTRIGYYRLSGYWYPYRKTHMAKGGDIIALDVFRVGTKFSEIVDLYVFDKKLRLLMMDVIERIEIALRVQVTLQLGKRGSHAHRDPAALHPNFSTRPDPITREIGHPKWLERHDDAFASSKEEFAKHFKAKYAGEDPPIWIAAELWDFGAMSRLYSGMRKDDQLAVAQTFGINSFGVMMSWLRHINVARNICAHHSRFWNKPNPATPAWPTPADCPDLGHVASDIRAKTRVYGLACVCAYLLRTINPGSRWTDRFKQTIKQFPQSVQVDLRSAGFPNDWEKANLWQ
jgi:abortive infection bacteriophage resistance protein